MGEMKYTLGISVVIVDLLLNLTDSKVSRTDYSTFHFNGQAADAFL